MHSETERHATCSSGSGWHALYAVGGGGHALYVRHVQIAVDGMRCVQYVVEISALYAGNAGGHATRPNGGRLHAQCA